MFGRPKCVYIYSEDGENVYSIPKKEVYKPLSKIMDNSQLSEFLIKFIEECLLKEEPSGNIMSLPMFKLMVKLQMENFLEDLNKATDMEGNVDWDKFFSDLKVTEISMGK